MNPRHPNRAMIEQVSALQPHAACIREDSWLDPTMEYFSKRSMMEHMSAL